MVQGRPGQAHRPGHVRKDLIPKKTDGSDGAPRAALREDRLVARADPLTSERLRKLDRLA